MINDDVISMPDTWEYPWYASWDLAFHTVALAMVDIDFAKAQLELMLRELYLHPSGQLPAYEWNFSDVNPPVHAWATLLVYETELEQRGAGDVAWLKGAFQKLLVNFTWWINRKDPTGRNVFEGGFLGLDNIGVFDRSAPLPTGGHLEQSDGTAWMAFFSQCMLGIALELASTTRCTRTWSSSSPSTSSSSPRRWTASATTRTSCGTRRTGSSTTCCGSPTGRPSGSRSARWWGCCRCAPRRSCPRRAPARRGPAGPAAAPDRGDARAARHDPRRPRAGRQRPADAGRGRRDKLRRILARMLDEDEFLSPHGLRALSRYHHDHPFSFEVHGQSYEVRYLPAESDTGMFGGNSNWRGPVWFPVNYLVLRGLLHLYAYYGDEFTVECPTGSGNECTLFEVADELGRRLTSIFVPDEDGRRPVYGGTETSRPTRSGKDLLFYEYFHGDNGAGWAPATRPGGPGSWPASSRPAATSARGPAGRRGAGEPRVPAAENLRTAVDRG